MQNHDTRKNPVHLNQIAGHSSICAMATALFLGAFLSGCSSSDSDSNQAPVAEAGSSQAVNNTATVSLDGSGSSDPDGDALSYMWTFSSVPQGSAASLTSVTSVNANFIPDVVGEYVVTLSVEDGVGGSHTDSVTIIAVVPGSIPSLPNPPGTTPPANNPPDADAGPDQTVDNQTMVNMDGSGSSDPDGDALSFMWTFVSVPDGSTATLTSATSSNSSFTPDITGDYVVMLAVEDGAGGSNTDTLTVIAEDPVIIPPPTSLPVADAGPDQTVDSQTTVNLDGSGSSDPDGHALSYSWMFTSVPQGSVAALVSPTSINPDFIPDVAGDYVVMLTVDDGIDGADMDTVTVIAEDPAANSPVADAGPDQQIVYEQQGVTIQLDGSVSSDPDGDALTFLWEIVSFDPSGALDPLIPVVLIDPDTESASFDVFALDQLGTYTIQLTVSDGVLEDTDTVIVEVKKSFPTASVLLGSGLFVGAVFGVRRRKQW